MNGYVCKRKQDQSQFGNNVQGEESDFEFMMTEEVKEDKTKEDQRKKTRRSYFEYSVMKPELKDIPKILLEKNYSISKAFKDAFKVGNYQQLFQLLRTMDTQTVKDAVKIKDDFGRNIFHALSKAPDDAAFNDICNNLIAEYSLDPNERDSLGNSPIMLAVQEGKYNLVQALEICGGSVLDTNNSSENCIHFLMRGKRIKKYNRKLLKYLMKKKVDINTTYEEPAYISNKAEQELRKDGNDAGINDSLTYKCTPLIHLLRTDLMDYWDKGDLIDEILIQKHTWINPNQCDSDGKDLFMHLASSNEYELAKYVIRGISKNYSETKHNELQTNDIPNSYEARNGLLKKYKGQSIPEVKQRKQIFKDEEDEEQIVTTKQELLAQEKQGEAGAQQNENVVVEVIPQKESKYAIDLSRQDNLGRTVVHYIVSPVSYGSYENEEFLEYFLKFGFRGDLSDNDGLKPQDYAIQQSSGSMLSVLIDQKVAPNYLKVNENLSSYKKIYDWEEINYLKDAQDYLDLIKMNVEGENLVPCDSAGKFNEDCIVYEDPEKGHYDCHLTRVDIGRESRDDYLFYKIQVVYDKGRDLWILFTRWGRIGEEGAFQKTPYPKDECIEQFEKIFSNKTKNEWTQRENFKKQWWKYQLTNVNYSNISHEDYLVPFDLANSKASQLQPQVQEIMREITQVSMYVKGLKNAGLDMNQMKFSNINRNDLQKARESLTKLREILEELEPMEANLNRFQQNNKDKIVSLREKMWYHSSRFYEMIPHEEFKNEIVPPINKMAMLKEKAEIIDNLINFEMASKILLGAHKNAKEVNPLDYCLKAMGLEIDALDKTSEEYNILKDYCVNTWPENKNANRKIRNIFKIQRKGEGEIFDQFADIGNKFLLFHGSKISNFMGIMSQGLRVAPPEAPKTGYMFGKGVYFADMFQKSFNYCNDHNSPQDGSKFMLLCETAVGKSYKLTHAQYMDDPPVGYDSTQGIGKSGPCYSKCFAFPEGYKIPKGKYLDYEYEDNIDRQVYLRHNEFIIYKNQQKDMSKVTHKSLPSNSCPGQIKMRYLIQVK